MHNYQSAIFDYDGTLTPKCGHYEIDPNLANLLIKLTYDRPFGICSARPFEFFRPVIDQLCSQSDHPELTRQNWYVVAENGATGYFWNTSTSDYQLHYQIDWPYPQDHIQDLYHEILTRFQNQADKIDVNKFTVIVRPQTYPGIELHDWERRNDELLAKVQPILAEYDPENKLAIVNSGIGFIVINRSADKDYGVEQFVNYLKSYRHFSLSPTANEIIVIGDRPNPGGNDEALLSGRIGTPFTVGKPNPANPHLKFLSDQNNGIIQAADATYQILNQHVQH